MSQYLDKSKLEEQEHMNIDEFSVDEYQTDECSDYESEDIDLLRDNPPVIRTEVGLNSLRLIIPKVLIKDHSLGNKRSRNEFDSNEAYRPRKRHKTGASDRVLRPRDPT